MRLLQRQNGAASARWITPSRPALPMPLPGSVLPHVVVTSVDRDDLTDGGAYAFCPGDPWPFRARNPESTIEVRLPTSCARRGRSRPSSRRGPMCSTTTWRPCPLLYLTVRPGARYFASLRLLQRGEGNKFRTYSLNRELCSGSVKSAMKCFKSWMIYASRRSTS